VNELEAAYDAVLARWPVKVERLSVDGTTRVLACGPADGEPLVLLPGGGTTATVWFANAGELARTHRVYAAELPTDAGTAPDLMAWLDGLLTGLGLDATDLCGHSYGGWIALTYALHAPTRVRRLALLDPTTCFAGFRPAYLLHAMPLLLRPSGASLRALLRWETGGAPLDPDWLRLVSLVADGPRSKIVRTKRPDAARLRALTVPLLVLVAGNSKAHDVDRVAANARALVPGVTVTTLPGVTHHSVPTAEPARFNRALLDFLR
jgi:pimeloyl-ACP methyl ester carboxylesterase